MQNTVKERLIDFIKSQNLSQGKFEKLLGFSNGYVNSISKGIGAEKLQRIIGVFPNLNPEWLLSGNGDMMITAAKDTPGDRVEMPREVFDKISQLVETICSQQQTISEQTRTISRLISGSQVDVQPENDATSAVAK